MYEKVKRKSSWVMRRDGVGWGGGKGVTVTDLTNVHNKEHVDLSEGEHIGMTVFRVFAS